MAQLTEQLFSELQDRASMMFKQQEAKNALILGRKLENGLPQIADSPSLYKKYQILTFQLKWLGLSLMQDSKEYSNLFQNHFLDGLTMPEGDINGPAEITAQKINQMFGIGTISFLNEILTALSKNDQKVGNEAILVSGEKSFSQPTIRNWLIDFIRSTPDEHAVNEVAVSNYLFNNANAKKLPPKDKNLLGRTLIFFCDFQRLSQGFAAMERQLPPIGTEAVHEDAPANNIPAPRASAPTQTVASRGERSGLYGTQKSLRQLVKDNKDALNQNLTSAPIKIMDINQPVRPTIKNWLVDYVKIKGAGHHETPVRNDYLSASTNVRLLPAGERALLAEILKAYDDELLLPIDEATQTILLNKITASEPSPSLPPKTDFTTPGRPIPPPPTRYREPVSEKDMAGPFGRPATSRPARRPNGNIIDLKDLQ